MPIIKPSHIANLPYYDIPASGDVLVGYRPSTDRAIQVDAQILVDITGDLIILQSNQSFNTSYIGDVNASVTINAAAILSLETGFSSIVTQIDENTSQLATNVFATATLGTEVSTLLEDLGTQKLRIDSNAASSLTLHSEIDTLTTFVDGNTTTIFAHSQSIAELDTFASITTPRLNDLEAGYTTTASSILTLQSDVTLNATNISGNTGDIATQATAHASLSTQVTGIEGDLSSVTSATITLDSQVTTINGQVSSLTSTMDLKVTAGEIIAGINLEADTINGARITIDGNTYFNNDVVLRGNLSGVGGTFTGSLSAATGSFTGSVTATSGSFTGHVEALSGTFNGTINASNGNFAGYLTGAGGTFWGELQAATGSFSGELLAATGTFTGQLSAATGSFNGAVTATSFTAIGGDLTFAMGSRGFTATFDGAQHAEQFYKKASLAIGENLFIVSRYNLAYRAFSYTVEIVARQTNGNHGMVNKQTAVVTTKENGAIDKSAIPVSQSFIVPVNLSQFAPVNSGVAQLTFNDQTFLGPNDPAFNIIKTSSWVGGNVEVSIFISTNGFVVNIKNNSGGTVALTAYVHELSVQS